MKRKAVIGTRRSKLALWQTDFVKQSLEKIFPDIELSVETIVTEGDKVLDTPLSKIGDKGLFTRAIENKLLDGTIDLAVHSYKDLPTDLPSGLAVGAVLKRAEPFDVLVVNSAVSLTALPQGSRIGTSSVRRKAQIMRQRPDFVVLDIRGNVDTRLKKLDNGEYDAIVLAEAGLTRLGFSNRITERLDNWYYAVGQGALAIEIRENDQDAAEIVRALHDTETSTATEAERAFLRTLMGGCQIPAGVRTVIEGNTLTLYGMICGVEGTPFLEGKVSGSCNNAIELGASLAKELRAKSGGVIF